MNSKTYRQGDSRWGGKWYPSSPSNVSSSGCGLLAVTHLNIEQKRYKSKTPSDFLCYMKKWAVVGQGTMWKGIYEALKRYGFKNVKWFSSSPMSEVFKECDKGGRIGVFLFSSAKGPDGKIWTSGGHYVAFTSYKKSGGKHYFYTKDSGFRHRDGWHCYETTMKGCIPQAWTCTVPSEQKQKRYSGEFPVLTVKTTANKIGHAGSNEKGSTRGGKAGDQTKKEVKISNFTYSANKDSHFHWEYMARAKDKDARKKIAKAMREACANNHIGYDSADADRLTLLEELKKNNYDMKAIKKNVECDCSSLVRACCYCAGIKPKNFRTGNQLRHLKDTEAFTIYTDSEHLTSPKNLKEGDILFKPNAHTCVVTQIGEQTSTRSIKKGDSRKAEVKKLQKFLKWYGYSLSTDGIFGSATNVAVKKFQKAEGLTSDGVFGSKALSKAKVVKR